MYRIIALMILVFALIGCQTAPVTSVDSISTAASGSRDGVVLYDVRGDRNCPKIDLVWPEERGTILMYSPGTVTEFTVSARVVLGDSDSLWVYLLISRFDGGTANLALTGYADRFDEDGFCHFDFAVDAADLACACEHELTAIVMDAKGCYGMDIQPVNFYWE